MNVLDIQVIEGALVLQKTAKIGIAVSRFNDFIVDRLQVGCVDTLLRHGIAREDLTVVKVPGCFELPVVVKRMALTGEYEAIIALGAVIRGATPHFEQVAGGCTRGLSQVAMEFTLPVIFGVLTVDTIEQAIERAGTKSGNKGADAAVTAIEMVCLLRQLPPDPA